MKRFLLFSALLHVSSIGCAESAFPEADQYIDCANVYTFYRREAPAEQHEVLDTIIGLSATLAEISSNAGYVDQRRREMLNDEYRKQAQAQQQGTFDIYQNIFSMKIGNCKGTLREGQSRYQKELDARLDSARPQGQ